MKRVVLIALALLLCIIFSGGAYIVTSIQGGTEKLEQVISLTQVELLRKTLENNLNVVQSDLLLQGSPHTSNEKTIQNIEKMQSSAAVCLTCHHEGSTKRKLTQLQESVGHYMKLYSRTLTLRANSKRMDDARAQTFTQGENLLAEIKSLSVASTGKISTRINKIHAEIKATNYILIMCIILVPIPVLIISMFFLRRFTGSIDILAAAAQTLEKGNLDYRIEAPLKYEFRTLANSFNTMAESLKFERNKFETAHKLHQTLFETAGDAIMITGLETETFGQIISANKAASELYDYSRDELLGMNLTRLIPDGKEDQFKARLKTISQGAWNHLTVKRKRKNGDLIPVDLSLGPIELDKQKYLLTICRDISGRLQAEEELQRANQMALVGQMAAGLAHEIKNPLAGVKVSLDVMVDELELQTEDREVFARVINEINRMEKLLKSLLNYARPAQPHFDLLDINRLLDNSIKNVEVTAGNGQDKELRFEKTFSADIPQIEADSAKLQQVFLNIFLNAIDAMNGSGTIRVTTAMATAEEINIAIADTGKGMSESSLEKTFTPFFTTKSKGTGLGLAISKRLIEQHDGTIAVDSILEQGTVFNITIPLTQKCRE